MKVFWLRDVFVDKNGVVFNTIHLIIAKVLPKFTKFWLINHKLLEFWESLERESIDTVSSPLMKLTLTWWGGYLTKRFRPVRQQGELGATQLHSSRTSIFSSLADSRSIYILSQYVWTFRQCIYHIVLFPVMDGPESRLWRWNMIDSETEIKGLSRGT